jgi:hypothetical protein
LLRRSYWGFNRRLRLWRLHWWNGCGRHFGHHRWIGFYPHELEVLFARTRSVRATPASTCGARAPTTDYVGTNEIRRPDDRRQNEKKDHRVQQKRRGDPFPIFFFCLALLESRVARSYFTSFGVVAITFTPAPRATSIAAITSWYFTVGSPLTKMILSGLGS